MALPQGTRLGPYGVLSPLGSGGIAGLSASPDGRTLLWGRSMYTFSTDLMMIEDFR